MSDGLNPHPWAPAPPPPDRPPVRWAMPRGGVLAVVGVVLLFTAGGAGGGWVWHALWNAPAGEAYQHQWVALDETALGSMFDATGLYLLVGVVGGLVLGLLVSLVVRQAELLVLAATLVGSVLAAWVCHVVGFALAPPDPAGVAASAADFTRIPGTMATPGHTFYVAWPLGALLGLGVVYLLSSSARHTLPAPYYLPTPPPPAGFAGNRSG